MNRNLNGQQFVQPSLFKSPRSPVTSRTSATEPSSRYMHTIEQRPNPLFGPDVEDLDKRMVRLGESQPDPTEEFVPTYELSSGQDTINPYAVNHLSENTRGLDTPNISVVRGGGSSVVYDGNHRTNAALRRGQMLIPANVYDIGPKRSR